MPPSLKNSGFLAAASDSMIQYIVKKGREGSPMPAFEHVLKDEEIHNLIAFIRSYENKDRPSMSLEDSPLTLFFVSPYSFEETVQATRDAVKAHNFRSFPDRFLEQGLTDEFSVNERQIIIRFCNFSRLYEALKIEPRLGTILPCKITIVEKEDGSVEIIAANIVAQARLFNNQQLNDSLRDVSESYRNILEEITF